MMSHASSGRSFAVFALALVLTLTVTAPAADLVLWARADDLQKKDGERVEHWGDHSGFAHILTATAAEAPTFIQNGEAGFPAVAFKCDQKSKAKVVQRMHAQLDTREYRGFSLLLVGTGLQSSGWLGTAPGNASEIRLIGAAQHCGSKAGTQPGFSKIPPAGLHLVELVAGMRDDGSLHLATYCDSTLLDENSDPEPRHGIALDRLVLGAYMDSRGLNGSICEVLAYDYALNDADRKAAEQYLQHKYKLGAASGPEKPPGLHLFTAPKDPGTSPSDQGLKVWLKADDVSGESGDEIAQWPNAAGDKQPASAPDGHRPELIRNAFDGHAVARFQNGGKAPKEKETAPPVQWLDTSISAKLQAFTLIVAGRNLHRAGLFDTNPSDPKTSYFFDGAIHCGDSKTGLLRGPFAFASTAELSVTALVVSSDGGARTLTTYVQSEQQAKLTDATLTGPIPFENLSVGAANKHLKGFGGDIAEVLLYDRALNDDERRKVESYLAAKYAMPLKSPDEIAHEPKPRSRWSVRLPQLPRQVTWMGNSESGKESWIQSGGFNSFVMPDGTVVQSCVWDEGHKEIGFYKDGHSVMTTNKEGKTVAKGFNGGGAAILVYDNKIYQGVSGMSKAFAGIRRLTMDGEEVPFKGVPAENKGRIAFPTSGEWKETRGLAVVGNELFVTCDALDEIKVYDLNSGEAKRTLPMPAPGRLAADASGKLWVGLKDRVVQITPDGKETGQEIKDIVAGGLAFDPKGRLLIADDGERQQVIVYDVSGAKPAEMSTVGVRGGVLAEPRPGTIAGDRIFHPRGVGADTDGNIYVHDNQRIRSFTPDGKMRWSLECTQFCLCADFDPAADGNDVYTWRHHYHYVPGQPPGRDWQWVGYTENEKRFPEVTNQKNIMIRYLNGAMYRFSANGDIVDAERREEGSETFIPCAQVHLGEGKEKRAPKAVPEKVRYVWTDRNDNGLIENDEIVADKPDAPKSAWCTYQWVDSKGDIWQPQGPNGLRHLPLKGFTPKGAPIYDLADLKVIPRPPAFLDVHRANYYPETDTMYLCGYTWEHQTPITEWVGAGPEVIRYANWSKPDRKVVSRMVFPQVAMSISSFDFIPSRDLMFAVEVQSAVVFAFDTKTGKLLGIVEPDPDLVGNVGWVDYPGGGLHAFERKNGEIVITVEESYLEKEMIYRLPPGFEKTIAPAGSVR